MSENNNNSYSEILKGKTFISTRPKGKSDELISLITQNGGEVLELPMIEIVSATLSDVNQTLFFSLKDFNWLIFTSTNGIICFFEALKRFTGSYNIPTSLKIGVLSDKMAAVLLPFGTKASLVSSGSTGEDFVNDLKSAFEGNHPRLLLAFGNLAREVIESGLKPLAEITRLDVYNTETPIYVDNTLVDRVISDKYDMIIFTSPSGFHNFCNLVEGRMNISLLRAASIGSTTTSALKEKGLMPLVTATTMNSNGIAEAILDYYKR